MEGAVPAASRRTRIYTSRLDDKLRARGERTEFLATFFHESAAIIHDRLNFRAHPHVTSHSPPDKLTPINNDRFFTDRKLISICSPIIYFELSLSLPFLDPFASVISPIQYFEPVDESHNGTDPSHDQFSGENRRFIGSKGNRGPRCPISIIRYHSQGDRVGGGRRWKLPLRAAGNGDRAFRVDISVRHRDRTLLQGRGSGLSTVCVSRLINRPPIDSAAD